MELCVHLPCTNINNEIDQQCVELGKLGCVFRAPHAVCWSKPFVYVLKQNVIILNFAKKLCNKYVFD